MKKLLIALGGAVVLLLGSAAPAWAHVEPTVEEAPAGGLVTFGLIIPHGCDGVGGDTVKVEVQMPEGVESATAQYIPGWAATVDDAGPVVVTWEGGALPHDQFGEFGLSVLLPDTPGEVAEFPTVQTCASGEEVSWIEHTVEGEDEPEHPAPAIALTESEGEHGHGTEETTDTTVADHGEGEATAAASSDDGSSDGTDNIAVIALVVGAVALLAAGYAVMTNRRAA
jgi:uncharacterized protein YcnI